MDFGRLILPNFLPRSRLDAGTLATMGVGVGYSIAAAITHPKRKIVAVLGDSAFGFSGMELEVICRYELPVTIIILNNNGIYAGLDKIEDIHKIPPTALLPNSRYEKIIEAFGGKGYFVTTHDQLVSSLKDAINDSHPTLVNVMIKTDGPIPKIVATKSTH